MKNRTITVLASILIASLALAGCPSLRVGQVRLAAPPKGGRATLVVDVETRFELEPDKEKESAGYSGAGVVAFWLPAGWEAVAARVNAPGEEQAVPMAPVPDLASGFPPTFPYQAGAWWPFVTSDSWIPVGTAIFPVEVDLQGPKRARAVILGVALGAIDNCEVTRKVGWEAEMDPPTEVAVDLRKGTVAVRDNPTPVATQLPGCVKKPEPDAGLEEDAGAEEDAGPGPDAAVRPGEELPTYDCNCPECPPPVERGPRGCSCHGPGAARPAPGLLGLLIGLVS